MVFERVLTRERGKRNEKKSECFYGLVPEDTSSITRIDLGNYIYTTTQDQK